MGMIVGLRNFYRDTNSCTTTVVIVVANILARTAVPCFEGIHALTRLAGAIEWLICGRTDETDRFIARGVNGLSH